MAASAFNWWCTHTLMLVCISILMSIQTADNFNFQIACGGRSRRCGCGGRRYPRGTIHRETTGTCTYQYIGVQERECTSTGTPGPTKWYPRIPRFILFPAICIEMQVREGEDSAHHGVEYMMYCTYVGGGYDATPALGGGFFWTGYPCVRCLLFEPCNWTLADMSGGYTVVITVRYITITRNEVVNWADHEFTKRHLEKTHGIAEYVAREF